jgi:DNA topoisomerase-1
MKGPEKDKDGNASVVRFSRKSQEHYLLTEVDKKPTGWKSVYRNEKWVVES